MKKLATSLIGLVSAGAKVAEPEASPGIDAAEKAAKDLFNSKEAKTKVRDAFGVDPGNGGRAEQEGGIIVCMPEAGGTYYSGRDRSRWIKHPGTRTDDHIPAHVYGCFFPIQGEPTHNTRVARQSGEMFVVAWDHAFDDNAGYYKVFVKLTKGPGTFTEPNPRRTAPPAKPKP